MPTTPTPLQWPPAWLADAPASAKETDPPKNPTPPLAESTAPAVLPVAQLVGDLRRRGHCFSVWGDRVRIKPPLPSEALHQVKTRKAEVRAYLVSEPPARPCFATNGIPICAHCAKPILPSRVESALCQPCGTVAGLNSVEDPTPSFAKLRQATGADNRADDPDADAKHRAAIEQLMSIDLT